RPSTASKGSEASEGARVDELPREQPINLPPPYPADALSAGIEGTVLLRLKIDADGKVIKAVIEKGSGTDSLDDSALRTLRRWLFYPARRNGQSVPFEVLKPIVFSIRR